MTGEWLKHVEEKFGLVILSEKNDGEGENTVPLMGLSRIAPA